MNVVNQLLGPGSAMADRALGALERGELTTDDGTTLRTPGSPVASERRARASAEHAKACCTGGTAGCFCIRAPVHGGLSFQADFRRTRRTPAGRSSTVGA